MGALKGIRVIDAANIIAGPYAASILSEFGADVIKVEMPEVGDGFRKMAPRKEGKSVRWPSMGRNKKCVTIDFHLEEGRQIFLDLVAQSDVVIENYRTGTFEKWGFGFKDLKKVNPKIILVHVTGYGQTGPNAKMSGFGAPCTSFAGLTYITGYPDRPPVPPAFSLTDYVAGLNAAIGTLLALYHRDAQGEKGQEIDVSLYEGIFRMQDSLIADYDINGVVRERALLLEGGSKPGGTFTTADGKMVHMICTTDSTFQYFSKAIGRPELFEEYPTMQSRAGNEVVQKIAKDWFASHDLAYIMEVCRREKVAVSPLYSIEDIFNDEHYKARNNLVEMEDSTFGKVHIPSVCPILSETPGEIKWTGQQIGESNEEVYKNLLGYSDEKIAHLKELHAI